MMNKKMIKIICIVLAALMGLSCIAVLTQVFAAEPTYLPQPQMGDTELRYIIPIAVVVLAIIIILICIILPKIRKKNDE